MKYIKIIIALLVIVGVAYWAFDSIQASTYSGDQVEFAAGSGNIVSVTHHADEALALDMTSRSGFAVTSPNADLSGSGTRDTSVTPAVYRYVVELPAGTSELRLTRGSNVTFDLEGASPAEIVVQPMDAESARNTVIIALVVILAALYYISSSVQHRWARSIIQKVTSGGQRQTPASQASSS
ncbi:MAG: hypothetical protein CL610_25540 [Anaerolineaceae bacterium]|nr:hypothetical protein [Anaerolineaceae bacterium]